MATYFVSLHSLLQRAQQAEGDRVAPQLECFLEIDYTNWPSTKGVEEHNRQSIEAVAKTEADTNDRGGFGNTLSDRH